MFRTRACVLTSIETLLVCLGSKRLFYNVYDLLSVACFEYGVHPVTILNIDNPKTPVILKKVIIMTPVGSHRLISPRRPKITPAMPMLPVLHI